MNDRSPELALKVPPSPLGVERALLVPASARFTFQRALDLLSPVTSLDDWDDVRAGRVSRPMVFEERVYLVTTRSAGRSSVLHVTVRSADGERAPGDAVLEAAHEAVTRRFALNLDMDAVRAALSVNDFGRQLLVFAWPARPPGLADPWEALLRSVIATRAFRRRASVLERRLSNSFGPRGRFSGHEVTLLPRPEALAAVAPAALVALGFRANRAEVLPHLAARFAARREGFTPRAQRARSSDDLVADLLALPGVSPWAAGVTAGRGFGLMDALTDEPGLRLIVGRGFNHDLRARPPSPAEFRELMSAFRPYRGLACRYAYLARYGLQPGWGDAGVHVNAQA